MKHPECSHCGYDLTGAPGNSCPECYQRFVEAGVILRRSSAERRRRTHWIAVASLIGLVGLGASMAFLRAGADKAMTSPKDDTNAVPSDKQGPVRRIPNTTREITKVEPPHADDRAVLTAPAWLNESGIESTELHAASDTPPADDSIARESALGDSSSIQGVNLAPPPDAVMAAYRFVVEHEFPYRHDLGIQFDGAVRESDYSQTERDLDASIAEFLNARSSLE